MRQTLALVMMLFMLNACHTPGAAPTNTPPAPTRPPTATVAPFPTLAPTADNYAVWNITPDGLLITFNEVQVAAYAAGAQSVLVPFEVVHDLAAPNGPLDNFIQ